MNAIVTTARLDQPVMACSGFAQAGIKSEIILGSPSVGCHGVGICRIMAYGQRFTGPCRKTKAWMQVTAAGSIRISFLKSEMTPGLLKQHFDRLWFRVNEPYKIPGHIVRELGLKSALVLPGAYHVIESAHFLTVDF